MSYMMIRAGLRSLSVPAKLQLNRMVRTGVDALRNNTLLASQAYINGKWVTAENKATFEVYDPATGDSLAAVPDMTSTETEEAIKAASCAQNGWAKTPLKERSAFLTKMKTLVDENSEMLAEIMTYESGKPIAESRGEVKYGNSFFEWFAEEAKRIRGDAMLHPVKRDSRYMIVRQPVGVSALITPWNFPLAMITRKAGAALAAGCCVVIKPAEDTPLTALAIAKIAEKAKLPAGVFNVVTCSRKNAESVGETLCLSSDVRKLSFTGSTPVGKHLYSLCGSTVKRISLELGGNAPFIVFDSADVDKAVQGAMGCKFRNTGQTCVCANRIFVQSGIYNSFCSKLAEKVKSLKYGHGMDPTNSLGPLINERAVVKVKEHVDDAISRGAALQAGGHLAPEFGPNFFQPTLVTDVAVDALVNREETFGPLAAVTKFETEDEVISMANSVKVGLAGYFYSNNAAQIFRVSEALEFGMIGVNEGVISSELAPFGGVKESGVGREGSMYGIEEYQELKYVNLNF
ncbi:glutarate-semialdehyde dehydrogenase-like [Convolutriloba macropyga]|uniref:glutarate-semialdehyde dehydrogenase-like n=2 Tax=Convolutriloba macropyga TaxID=536237 RepID=UPI003F51F950